jgi:hypothetical protein
VKVCMRSRSIRTVNLQALKTAIWLSANLVSRL